MCVRREVCQVGSDSVGFISVDLLSLFTKYASRCAVVVTGGGIGDSNLHAHIKRPMVELIRNQESIKI